MQKQTSPKRGSTSTRRFRVRPIWLLSLIAILFVLCGVLLTFAHSSQASTDRVDKSARTPITIATKVPQQSSLMTPTISQTNSKTMGPQQPTITPVHPTITAIPTLAVSTPTLIASTPQHTQLGVFSLSSGGPLPVPESVLHPTNIARVMLGSTLVSVYAGSMSSNPQAGILCVLREDLSTGQLHLQVYQGPQTGGALTILSVQNSVLKVKNTNMQGSFDLNTNTFQW
jgi:hypothetical protein